MIRDTDDREKRDDVLRNMRSNIIEFDNGAFLYVDYEDGKLIAGHATNNGIIPEYEMEYDHDLSVDANLSNFYDMIVEQHPEYLEYDEEEVDLSGALDPDFFDSLDDYFDDDTLDEASLSDVARAVGAGAKELGKQAAQGVKTVGKNLARDVKNTITGTKELVKDTTKDVTNKIKNTPAGKAFEQSLKLSQEGHLNADKIVDTYTDNLPKQTSNATKDREALKDYVTEMNATLKTALDNGSMSKSDFRKAMKDFGKNVQKKFYMTEVDYNNMMDELRKSNQITEDMKITRESDLTDFEFWGGARDRVKYLDDDELRTISNMLDEIYPEGMSETAVNDFFWFEEDTVAEWLGYDSFDKLLERNRMDEDLSDRIRKGDLEYDDEVDAWKATEDGVAVQFQDRETHTHEFGKNRKLNKHPKTSTHTWGRVWKDGKLVKNVDAPKYQARAEITKYLDDSEDALSEDMDTVTRYQMEYYLDDDDDRLTDYIYAESRNEAEKKLQAKVGDHVLVAAIAETVPAQYKEWDMPEDGDSWKNESLKESKETKYYYITKHGVGPGTVPKDVEVTDIVDLDNNLTSFHLNRFLTTKELDRYDIYPETHDIYMRYPDKSRVEEACGKKPKKESLNKNYTTTIDREVLKRLKNNR